MSLIFGSTEKLPQPDQKMLGQDTSRLPTNEQARPLPWFAGTCRMGHTYISDPFNEKPEPVYREVGKDDEIAGHNYSASFAVLIALGRVDRLSAIYINDQLAWKGTLNRSGDSSLISIEGRGQMRIYWGTETQGIDTHLALAGEDHSAMRGQCYVVFERFFFGFEQLTAPKIEFVLSRWPSRSWMNPAKIAMDQGCNPVYAIADFLQDARAGASLRTVRLNTDAWNAAADIAYSEGIGISPFLSRQTTLPQWIIRFAEYIDSYLGYGADGRVEIGLVRSLVGDAPVITKNDLLGKPKFKALGWEGAATDLKVKYTSGNFHFRENVAGRPNAALRRIIGAPRSKTVDRSWITSRTNAETVWSAMSRAEATPKLTGTLWLKGSTDLRAGSLFFLCYPPRNLDLLCRATEVTIAAPGQKQSTIQFRADFSYLTKAQPITEEAEEDEDDDEPLEPTPVDPIVHQRLLDVPYGLKNLGYVNGATFLVARPDALTTSFNAHLKKTSDSFESTLNSSGFALHGTLQERYQITGTFDELVGMRVVLDGPDVTLPAISLGEAFDNEWLLFAGDEIISIFGTTLLGEAEYRVYGIRARYDTVATVHLGGSDVFIAKRSQLPNYIVKTGGALLTFKMQPFVLAGGRDLSEVEEVELACDSRGLRPWAPKNLRAFDARQASYTTGQDVELTWSTTAPDGAGEDIKTVLELYVGTSLMKRFILSAGTEEYLLPNAALQTALGGEVSFTVRAYHRRGIYVSTRFDEITVTKV